MKSIKIGSYLIPLWLIVTLLISEIGVAVLAYQLWNTIIIPRRNFGDSEDYSQLGYITSVELRIFGIKAMCQDYAIGESVTVLLLLERSDNEPTEPFRVKCAIYVDQGVSKAKYAETETRELWEETNSSSKWYTFSFPDPKPLLERSMYWIVVLAQHVPGFVYLYYGTEETQLYETFIEPVTIFEFPAVLPNPTVYNGSFSAYCTYSLTGPLRTPFMIAFIASFMIIPLLAVIVYIRKRHRIFQERLDARPR